MTAGDRLRAPGVLYDWLRLTFERKGLRRSGHGTRNAPYRYRLENADDAYYDRGELPPLRPLPGLR